MKETWSSVDRQPAKLLKITVHGSLKEPRTVRERAVAYKLVSKMNVAHGAIGECAKDA